MKNNDDKITVLQKENSVLKQEIKELQTRSEWLANSHAILYSKLQQSENMKRYFERQWHKQVFICSSHDMEESDAVKDYWDMRENLERIKQEIENALHRTERITEINY